LPITIRRAVLDDAYDFALCKNKSWQSAYRGIVPDDYLEGLTVAVDKQAGLTRQWMNEQKDSEYYCVNENGEVVGVLVVNPCRDEDKPNAGEITAMYLLEEYWNKGYGREMMDFAMAALKRMKYTEIIIWVFEENERARNFYEKFEFAYDGTRKEFAFGVPLIGVRYTRKT